MNAAANDIGVFGLGVMGRNLALNIADHGFAVAAYNRTHEVTRVVVGALAPGQLLQPCDSPKQLVDSLKRPRRILIMVKAGGPVDAVIGELEGLLEPGDVLVDGGNSHFADTERRAQTLGARGIHFLGVGISGGESGARTGPSLMPGGPLEAYEEVRAVFEAIAARVDGKPCVSYLGTGGAGHYVKMVHNGIEYGFMQLIADSYALLKQRLGLSNDELAAVYARWNEGELESYLVAITAAVFARRDEKTGGHLVDFIVGEAGQLGTGKWASQSAMDVSVPVPNIDIAVSMRNLSALEEERVAARALLGAADPKGERAAGTFTGAGRPAAAGEPLDVEAVRDALLGAMVITYAQGFAQLQAASAAVGWGLRLDDIASIWRGGCIVRAALLRDIKAAFRREPGLPNLLLDVHLGQVVGAHRDALALAVEAGISAGIAVPGLMTALAYLDEYRTAWSPSNLIQAQRDYFGAHTYRRVDEDGVFHTDWLAEPRSPE